MNLENVNFLFDNQLIAALEKLIKNARLGLFVVSPFIDLDYRIKDALKEKVDISDFEIQILFGKNEQDIYKSIKKDSLNFLKQFPNIDIRYNPRLHAKFYMNEFQYLMTSLNLYNYSLANNIEIGLLGNYASKGTVARALESGLGKIAEGTERLKRNLFGISDDDEDPAEKLQKVFHDSEVIFKTSPIEVDQNGLKGILGIKKYDGFNVLTDKTKDDKQLNIKETKSNGKIVNIKKISAKQLAISKGLSQNEINILAQEKGLISNNQITKLGESEGLEYRFYMGNKFVVFPEDLLFPKK